MNGAPTDPRALGLVKAAYGVNETLDLLSIGPTSLYAAVNRGELTPVKFGKKTLFYDISQFGRDDDTGANVVSPTFAIRCAALP